MHDLSKLGNGKQTREQKEQSERLDGYVDKIFKLILENDLNFSESVVIINRTLDKLNKTAGDFLHPKKISDIL